MGQGRNFTRMTAVGKECSERAGQKRKPGHSHVCAWWYVAVFMVGCEACAPYWVMHT